MPELPEVETIRIQIDKAARGHTIKSVFAADDSIVFDETSSVRVKKLLLGAKIVGTDRRGKYFWLKLNRKPWPVFHLGMSGRFDILSFDASDEGAENIVQMKYGPKKIATKTKRPKSLKLEIVLENGVAIWFRDPRRFGRVRVSGDPLKEGPTSKLGFDPLFNFPSTEELHKLICKKRSPIKSILLDQSIFAGVGNWIADEVLYQSRISPHRKGSGLSAKDTARIRKNVLDIVRKAVRVSANDLKYPADWLFHFRWGKSKKAKTSRGHLISFDTIGGRTSAWVKDLQT